MDKMKEQACVKLFPELEEINDNMDCMNNNLESITDAEKQRSYMTTNG